MAITPNDPANFTPARGSYKELSPFRFWCQKVLPLVYDDSLSYYELLNKVVNYLNMAMEDVTTLEGDVTNLHTAYVQLQTYVNDYFISLDVQQEINNKLDEMANNGELNALINPLLPDLVSSWLAEHMTPTTPPIDDTLTIRGAAADAKATGDLRNAINDNKNQIIALNTGGYIELNTDFTEGGYISNTDGSVVIYNNWKYTDYIDISDRVDNTIFPFSTSPDNNIYNAYYDSDKNFISYFKVTPDVPLTDVPVSAKYVRMSVQINNTCGVKIKTNGIADKASKQEVQEIQETEETFRKKVFYDLENVTANSDFVAGGLEIGSGLPYNGQYQRIHSGFKYALKDIIISSRKNIQYSIGCLVFLWNNNTPDVPADTISPWINLGTKGDVTYTIPYGKYYRILVTYWSESGHEEEIITDVFESYLFRNIRLENKPEQTSIAELNTDVLQFVQGAKSSYPANAKSYFSATHTPLSILHFSDVHQRPDLWTRIMEYADENEQFLDLILHTGDYVNATQEEYTDLYAVKLPKNLIVYNCNGNHDTYTGQGTTNPDKSVAYNLIFNHQDGWNVTFENDIDYSMTYYKDFVTQNIRLVVFDNYYDEAKQLAWLRTILADANTKGLHVITASHQVTGRPNIKYDTPFQTAIPYETAGTGSVANTAFDSVIAEAKNAGMKHIVHLAGHEHEDWFYKTVNGVVNCAVECATMYMGWTEGNRVANTKSMDCFNIFSADTDLGIFKIIRIGHNADSHNRSKNILTFDYINENLMFTN